MSQDCITIIIVLLICTLPRECKTNQFDAGWVLKSPKPGAYAGSFHSSEDKANLVALLHTNHLPDGKDERRKRI